MAVQYTTVRVPLALGGLNKDLEPTEMKLPFSPNMKNMVVETGRLRKRLGYSTLGTNLPLNGTGMELVQYVDARGNIHLVALTTTLAYEYDTDSESWELISPSTEIDDCDDGWDDTIGAPEANMTIAYEATIKKEGTKSIKLTLGAAKSDGDLLAYSDDYTPIDVSAYGTTAYVSFWLRSDTALASGAVELVLCEDTDGAKTNDYVEAATDGAVVVDTWTYFTIAVDVSALNAVKCLAVYANATLANGTDLYIDDVRVHSSFNGNDESRWSHTVATDANEFTNNGGSALCITNNNGTDKIMKYEGSAGDVFAELDTGITGFAGAKEVIELWNHLFLLNYNDGNQAVRSYKYSDVGDVDDYAAGTSATGTLTDTIGEIVRAKKLGSDMIIYSDRSITTARYVGGNVIFVFPTLVYGSGLFAPKGIWDFVNIHYFIGTDQKIYGYSGGRELQQVGKPIEDSFFEDADVGKKAHIVAGLDISKHLVHFFFPKSSNTYAKNSYSLNHKRVPNTWEYHEFYDTVRDFSLFSNQVAWRCNGAWASGRKCDEQTLRCDESISQTGYPQPVFLTHDGYVMLFDEGGGDDNGQNIECVYDTWDATLDKEEHQGRWQWFAFNAKSMLSGGTVAVEYSTDSGLTWTAFNDSPVTLSTDWFQHRLNCDVVSRRIRVRFTQNSKKDFQIRHDHTWRVLPKKERA